MRSPTEGMFSFVVCKIPLQKSFWFEDLPGKDTSGSIFVYFYFDLHFFKPLRSAVPSFVPSLHSTTTCVSCLTSSPSGSRYVRDVARKSVGLKGVWVGVSLVPASTSFMSVNCNDAVFLALCNAVPSFVLSDLL